MTTDETGKKPKASAPRAKRSTKAPVKKPVVAGVAKPQGLDLKKNELIDLVVQKSGVDRKYTKPVIEAMLEVLGDTVTKGREMNLQPLGKVKYNRVKETDDARIVILKLRQNKPAAPNIKVAPLAPKA